MKRKICALLLAAMMTCTPVLAENMTPDAAQVTVQGTAQVTAKPDMVTVTAGSSVTAATVGDAQAELSVIIASAADKLLELGVLEEDIVTGSYSCYPRYNYDTDTLIGYEASHTLEITCRDVEMLDSVIGALTDSGLSQIQNVVYDISTRSELYLQALEMAIGRAEVKAARMAAMGGMTLTGLVSLSENGGYGENYVVSASQDGVLYKNAALSAGIRPGSVSVGASVTVVYEAAK